MRANAASETPTSIFRIPDSFRGTRRTIRYTERFDRVSTYTALSQPMRQVVITRYGTPDVMQLRESPDPSPGDGRGAASRCAPRA